MKPTEGRFQLLVRAETSYFLGDDSVADVASWLQGTYEVEPGILVDVIRQAFEDGDLEVAVVPARNASSEDLDDVLLRERTDVPDLDIPIF